MPRIRQPVEYEDTDNLYERRFLSLCWGHHPAVAAILAHEELADHYRNQVA